MHAHAPPGGRSCAGFPRRRPSLKHELEERSFRLMPRRRVLVLALAGLAVVALGVAPRTGAGAALAGAVGRQIRAVYRLDFAVKGRTTVALLPVPRLKFENVTLSGAG